MVPHVTSLFTEKGKTFVGKYDHKNNLTIKTAAHLCTQQSRWVDANFLKSLLL